MFIHKTMKEKRVVKSKEELLAEMKNNTRFIEKMKFVREKLYPAVVESSDNIDDAKMFLSSINTVLMERFLDQMKKKTFKELGIIDGLDKDGEKFGKYQKLLALFDDMSVFDAKDYIEGMRSEIDLWITDELKERPMSTLKVTWIDEM